MQSGGTAIHLRTLKKAPLSISSPQLWILLAVLIIGILFQYPQQIFHTQSPSLLSFMGLNRHAVERILFLIPIAYAGLVFGLRAGLVSLILSLAIMLPRVFLLSDYLADALVETIAIIILGLLVNLWLKSRDEEKKRHEELLHKLEESERGMDISEQKYRYLFENASDAIWVQDINGLFVDGNRAWEKLSGFSVQELKGVHLGIFLSGNSLELAKAIRKKLEKGEELEQPYEQQFYVKGGSLKTVKMSTSALLSGDKITGFEHVARDITEEKQRQENVQAYIRQITRAQEEERKRISRDLHDDVSPDIIILIQKLDKLTSMQRFRQNTLKENLEEVRGQAEKALKSLRATAQGLRPRIIDDLGLVAALEWIAEELQKDQNILTKVETKNMERALSPETQILLFRIAQEALNNIRKHAHASRVTIKIEGGDKYIEMAVTDNGQGFRAPEKIEGMAGTGGLGIMGMYERARLLNGTLQIKSAPGKGTEITVRIPYSDDD